MIRWGAALLLFAAAVPAAAAQQAAAVDPGAIVGLWSASLECRDLIDYRRDGTYRTSANESGRWSLRGNLLTMQSRGQVRLVVRMIGRNQMAYSLAGSRAGTVPGLSYRCRSRGRAAR